MGIGLIWPKWGISRLRWVIFAPVLGRWPTTHLPEALNTSFEDSFHYLALFIFIAFPFVKSFSSAQTIIFPKHLWFVLASDLVEEEWQTCWLILVSGHQPWAGTSPATQTPTEHLVEFVETRRACSAVIRVIRVVIRTGLLACVHTRYAVEEYYAWDCILNMLDMCDMHLQQLIKRGSTTWHIYQGWPPCLAIDFRFCQIWRKA